MMLYFAGMTDAECHDLHCEVAAMCAKAEQEIEAFFEWLDNLKPPTPARQG